MLSLLSASLTEEEKDIFDELYNRYNKDAYNIAFYYTHDNYLAQETVQEAFIRALKYIRNFLNPEDEEAKNLFLLIVKQCALNILRREQRYTDGAVYIDDENFPELQAHDKKFDEDIEDIYDQIENLNDLTKTEFVLYYGHGYTYREIAEMLSRNEATVRKSIERARKAIQKSLKGDDGIDEPKAI